jgi:elongation factor G
VPNHATARINGIVAARRGQILGFDARTDWPGWDVVRALMPEEDIHGLIVEIRSATQGVGFYTARFDHLEEVTGKHADHIVAAHKTGGH